MDETRSAPSSQPIPPGSESGSERRATLRRFHFGDLDAAAGAVPPEVLPVALHPLRGVEIRGEWPLLIDPDPNAGPFARSFEGWLAESSPEEGPLAEHRERLARRVAERVGHPGRPGREVLSEAAGELAAELEPGAAGVEELAPAAAELANSLPEGATLIGFDRDAPLELARRAAERRLRAARERFTARAAGLAAIAETLLEADRSRRPSRVPAEERVGRFGALGSRFVDPKRLAGIVEHRKAGEPLSEERLRRLEQALELLRAPLADDLEPLWLLPRDLPPRELGGALRYLEDPCAAAVRAFDRRAEEVAPRVRAARLVALEAENLLEPERHLPWLEQLDWRAFEADELGLVPPVFAVVRRADLLGGGLAALSRLLLSERPVQILVLDEEERRSPEIRLEPALIGMAHREAFVHQGSIARPESLAANLDRALASGRTALHVIDVPAQAPGEIDPWLVAAARLSGRAAPGLVYDPDAGGSWSSRLRLDGNPGLLADWPAGPLATNGESAATAAEAFTFADAALLAPAWRLDFALADDGEEELVPLAEWLGLSPEDAVRRLPFVRAAGPDGEPLRLVVTRALASAVRDRLAFWRGLEEVAGVRSEPVDQAAEKARSEAEERAAAEREELVRKQTEELESVRASADSAAAARIVQALISLGGGAPVAIAELAAPGAAPPAAPLPEPPLGAAAEAPAVEEAPGVARVDTALCTSCDECIRKFPAIFAYDANKQAYLKDPRGGSFRDLVLAAAACSARVIHPGAPWNPSEPDLEKWVERAKAYQ